MYQEWQDRHARRAFDYLPEDERPPRSSRKAREQHAVRLLAFHFTGALLPVSQTAWLDGALTRLPVNKVEEALADILVPIMMGVEPADLA
jgi:hypothetical protein